MKRVLVTYASKQGSTKEVAESIATTLGEETFEVDVKSTDAVANVIDYDCVIVGAPINGMRWMQEAVDFIGIHQLELKDKKTAYFSLSYTAVLGRKMWKNQIVKAFEGVSKQVTPVKTGTFAGRVDGELPSVMRFVFGVPKDTPNDQRDWNLIKEWTKELIEEIKSE